VISSVDIVITSLPVDTKTVRSSTGGIAGKKA
jgi:hypothetical protein